MAAWQCISGSAAAKLELTTSSSFIDFYLIMMETVKQKRKGKGYGVTVLRSWSLDVQRLVSAHPGKGKVRLPSVRLVS